MIREILCRILEFSKKINLLFIKLLQLLRLNKILCMYTLQEKVLIKFYNQHY